MYGHGITQFRAYELAARLVDEINNSIVDTRRFSREAEENGENIQRYLEDLEKLKKLEKLTVEASFYLIPALKIMETILHGNHSLEEVDEILENLSALKELI